MEEAANRRGLSFDVIQKDFWVCFTLERLFGLADLADDLHFKGGTSLSKCFGIIERFSEDIDLTIGRTTLGFEEDYLLTATSKSQSKKRKKSVAESAFEYVSSTLFPRLDSSIGDVLGESDSWGLEDVGRGCITFRVPADAELTEGSYLKPEVRLEIGGLSDLEPHSVMSVTPYAAEVVPEVFSQKEVEVQVLSATRTLCDKLLLLHRFNALAEVPQEQSRHFYDVAELTESPARDELLEDLSLLDRAIDYERRTFPRKGIDYESLSAADLRVAPPSVLMSSLRRDYASMREMFFAEPPDLEEISERLTRLESDLQARAGGG